jgi:AraC-like DNA-binding protein
MRRRMISRHSSCAAFWVRGIAAALESEGLKLGPLFAEAGLDLAALDNPDARFASDKVDRLWQVAVQRSSNPTLGLASARTAKPASFDIVAYAMMSAPNLLGILERMARYIQIFSDTAHVTVAEVPEGVRLALAIFSSLQPVPWQRYGFDLLTLLSFCRWVTARDLRPIALELAVAPASGLEPYGEAFGCPLRFDAPANALLLSSADVMLPLPTAQPLLARLHERVAEEHLRRANRPSMSLRVHGIVSPRLPGGGPTRAEVAAALAVSERTLHRRLGEEGTSFQRILDDARRELAERHLGRGDLSLAEIAYLLGFSDQSSLFRASKRWFGSSPRQGRRRRAVEPA